MSVAELAAAARTRNGTGEHLATIRKRDGREVPFDEQKIFAAVKRCFMNGTHTTEAESQRLAAQITRSVVNVLRRDGEPVNVEHIQRIVIQQLWALELFDAAEHYQNYREERRKAREESPIADEFRRAVAEDAAHFPNQLQYYQFLSKFARFNDAASRRETWREACNRVMGWFKKISKKYRVSVREEEWAELDDNLYGLKAACAMRVVQMAGPALERCEVGVYNCAYHPIDCLEAFAELLYILMQGTGAGFSVEYEYVSQLPRIRKQKTGRKAVLHKHKIADSTEGWCDALLFGLKTWFAGEDVEFDDSSVRPAGARLKTKGGRASGPQPLRDLLAFTRKIIMARQGSYLTDLDVHDICCMTGKIVQVGGVRRASSISLSDLDSQAMREAKFGDWYPRAKWRSMANNSATYEERPDAVEFMEEWLALAKSGAGERGILNRAAMYKHLPARRKKARFGMNPCGEIILRPKEFCNLTIVVARIDDTEETLTRKVRAATFFGKLQSLCTDFRYLSPEWKKNCEEERLLGVDITGHADCPLLRYGAPGRAALLRRLAKVVEEVDVELSERWGVNRSAADTCVKPAGDSAILFDCGSGISAWFGDYILRWVRQPVNDPVTSLLKDEGVPWAVAPEDDSLVVFGFLRKAPPGATRRRNLTAIQQLENWLEWKLNWAEHSVACTIYVRPEEWLAVGHWVHEHFDDISGLSFLPADNGTYTYAPNEELTEKEYQKRLEAFPQINWAKLTRYEKEDMTTSAQTPACTGELCERIM